MSIAGQAVKTVKYPAMFSGQNDQGLAFSSNQLNNSSAPPVGNDPSKILAVTDFGTWILGNFKNVPEVKAAMLSGDTQIWLPNVPDFGNVPYPEHYAIFDKTGGSLVVEFFDGKVNVHDNPANVLTNGPTLPWHLENLNNYTFTNLDKNTGQLGNLKLATVDSGIALTALPSSQTAAGRFVKAAFYANYVRKAKTPDEAVVTLAHIMNNFDRPYDLTVDGAGGVGDGPRSKNLSSEVSYLTMLHDLNRNLYYIRSINSMNWSVIDLNTLKHVKEVKSFDSYSVNQAGADVYTLFAK